MSGPSTPQLGEVLRTFRLHAGMSQEALSESSGVSVRTISDLERGQRASAHPETIRLLATSLNLSRDDRLKLIELAHPTAGAVDSIRARLGPNRWAATLPGLTTPIVGRAHELDELTALLQQTPGAIVTLTGPGGVGKTRLALEAVYRIAPEFAGGVAFVDLAVIRDTARVPDAIAGVLGLTLQPESPIEQLARFLSHRGVLLILDNFEQLLDASPFVAQLNAACPRLAILVTSRVRLRLSTERELVLSPLSLATVTDPLNHLQANEANLLFTERAKRVDPQFALSDQNAVAVTEICRRLDGLPLAIELAASRLRILTVPALLEQLDRRLPLLTGGDRDRHPRQQSMRETIAWSYDLLNRDEQRFLRWMSIFAGGLSIESAEALGHALGLNASGSLDTVSSLVECGLAVRTGLSSDQPRFHLFETIREFGLEQLAETGELELAQRFHAEHFLAFASRDAPPPYEPTSDAWVGRLATEHPNLLEAFDYLCVPETVEQSLRFAAAMGPYWSTRGPFSEWQAGLSRAIEHASPEPTIVQTYVLYWLTMILGASPDFSAALQGANRCVEMADQVGTPNDRAAALHIRAWVHECHQHWEIAREQCDQAIELSITAGNTYMQAMCLMMKATSACALGELDHAQREAEQAASMFRALGALDQCALIGCVLAMIAVARGELALAATYCEESLRTWLSTETLTRWFRPLVGLAYVAAAIGQFATAARLLGAAGAMLIAGGRDLSQFDRPTYERAETRCREALGLAKFEEHQLAGSLLTPDAWLLEANDIVEAARHSSTSRSL